MSVWDLEQEIDKGREEISKYNFWSLLFVTEFLP